MEGLNDQPTINFFGRHYGQKLLRKAEELKLNPKIEPNKKEFLEALIELKYIIEEKERNLNEKVADEMHSYGINW